MVSAKRLSGINPLAYIGVEPTTPAPLFVKDRSPTVNDYQNFNIGTFWLVTGNSIPEEVWMLVALSAGIATWVQLYPGGGGGGGANEFPCDSGTANEAGGILNVLGDGNVTTSGAGNTITISLAGTFSEEFDTDAGTATPAAGTLIVHGGTNIGTTGAGNTVTINLDPSINLAGSLVVGTTSNLIGNVTFNGALRATTFGRGVVQSDSTGVLFSSNGTNGQVIIAATGGTPLWRNLTSLDSSITITNGANSIDLSAVGGGGGGAINFPTNSGTATEAGGVLRILGGTNIGTVGAGNTVTVNLDPSVTLAGSLNVGTTLDVTGASQLTGNVLFEGNVTVNNFSAGVVQSDNLGLLSSSKGNNGQVLIGSTAGSPAWADLTSSDGSIVIVNGPNSIDLLATGGGGGGGGASCAFLAHQASSIVGGLYEGGVYYPLGTQLALVEDYDVGGDFYPGNGTGSPATFTAPITGKYYLQLNAAVSNSPSASSTFAGTVRIVTPARTYESTPFDGLTGSSNHQVTPVLTVCADLNQGDVVTFQAFTPVGTGGGSLDGQANPIITFCSGFLVSSGGVVGKGFSAYQSVDTPVLSSHTYTVGTQQALTTIFDATGGFYNGDGAGSPASFTAPFTGTYNLYFSAQFRQQSVGVGTVFANIVTPTFTYTVSPISGAGSFITDQNAHISALVALNVGDVVTFTAIAATSNSWRLHGLVGGQITTYISGYRVS